MFPDFVSGKTKILGCPLNPREELESYMAQRLRARRVGGGPSTLVLVLAGLIIALVVTIAILFANSSLFRDPTAEELARREALAALEESPRDPGLLMTLAEIEYSMGRTRDALDHAGQAVDNAGETTTIFLRYAMLLAQENRLDEAKVALETELTIDHASAEAYFLLAQVLEKQGDLAAALDAMLQALEINPVDGDFRIYYADLLAAAGYEAEAESAYRAGLQVLPGDERAIQGLERLGVTYEETSTPNPHGN